MSKNSFANISSCPCGSCKHREKNINQPPCVECSVTDWGKYEYKRRKLTTSVKAKEEIPKFSFGEKP